MSDTMLADLFRRLVQGGYTEAEANRILDDAKLQPGNAEHAEFWKSKDETVAVGRFTEDATAVQQRNKARAALLRGHGHPQEALWVACHAEPIETPALRLAKAFLKGKKLMLVLAGGPGVGKTSAAAWAAMQSTDSAPGFLRAGELERRGRYDQKLEAWLRDKTSLVIDDVGVELLDSKGVFRSLFDEAFDRCWASRSVLIVTTNLTDEQFKSRYGDRVWSRLLQRGSWGNCGARDLRRDQQPTPGGRP